jgi:predicted neuraminidase
MGIWALLLFAIPMTSCSQRNDEKVPALAIAGKGPLLSATLIYSLDHKPTAECHASTIVELSDGLAAAWFGGTHERHPDVGIWFSLDLGGTWSKPVQVVDGFQHDSLRYPTWNPVLFKPEDGPLMLFYKVGPNPREWWGMLVTSDDGGRSWSKPRKLGEDAAVGELLGPVKNKPVQLADGTLLCPSSTEVKNGEQEIWRAHIEMTRDGGKNWEVYGPIEGDFNAIQPSILTYSDGRMQILCRTREQVVAESWSTDQGRTWSPMEATLLPNPNSGTDAVTLKDGRQLLVYNHTVRKGPFPSGRDMINVAVSSDGVHWKTSLTLERSEGEYSYPAVIQTSDGLVHITYTFNRLSIKHVVVDPAKL